MKFLNEAFGQSEELNTFVAQLERKYNMYYEVVIDIENRTSRQYFVFEDSAREYYNKMWADIRDDVEYYQDAWITLNKVYVALDREEIMSDHIDLEDEEV